MKYNFIVPRSLIFAAMVLLLLQLEACGNKAGSKETSKPIIPDSLKRYPFRSAIIELRYGGIASGKQMVYIDDFGVKEATIDSLSVKMMGMDVPNYKMEIKRGDSLYQIDFVRGMATKGIIPMSSGDEKAMSAEGEAEATRMGMKKGEDTVAGRKCAVWTSQEMGTKTWLWNGIALKSEVHMGDDKILLDAVNVKTDVPVTADHFDPPTGVHYMTSEDIQKMVDEIDKKSITKGKPKKGKDK